MFGKRDTWREIFLSWTHEIVMYRLFTKLLRYHTPVFYRYCFWLLKFFKLKSSLLIFRRYLTAFNKLYVFFPFHKVAHQMHLKDVDFYQFFLKNKEFKGFFLPRFVFKKTIKLLYKKKLDNYSDNFFGGLNYPVINTTWNFFDNINLNKKKFESKLNWNKADVSLKNVVNLYQKNVFILFYDVFIFNYMFEIYLNFLKEIYSFFILFILLKID